jgi:ubiquinone/menaquinone biosynthesis C-methylase UbiE
MMDWRQLKVSTDRTHHVAAGRPAYAPRFDLVLSFHDPGLAPVTKGALAWHIYSDGSPAYDQRFQNTFGFYGGLAAVKSDDGWHHIHQSGTPAYAERHAWCGNFQEGRCSVRSFESLYSHIDTEGQPAYSGRWRYAGDYREGMAVVQAAGGLSSHIDPQGNLVHGQWFEDLDIFHKGLARARDRDGWTHIAQTGKPAYHRRFAAVEPFYNGQARVERFDGGLEVIDESGCALLEPRAACRSDFSRLSGDMVGFWRTQAIGAAVRLGVIEALPAADAEIAKTCGLTPDGARRILRALGELHLVIYDGQYWNLTDKGAYLRIDHPLTLADAALEYSGAFYEMWARLPGALCDGASWSAADLFEQVADNNTRYVNFHRMLASYAAHDYQSIIPSLNIHDGDSIIDAGGGIGILAEMIIDYNPSVSMTVLDRGEVIEIGKKRIASSAVKWRAGNMFDFWNLHSDIVLLSRVLHDWDDDKALQILQRARETMKSGGRIFIIEMLLGEDNVFGSLCDLHLLMVTGGRERSARGYNNLLIRAGFKPVEVRGVAALPSIIAAIAI